LRILLICDHFPTYGTKSVWSLAAALTRRGHEVAVASTSVGIRGETLSRIDAPFEVVRFPSIAIPHAPYTYTPQARRHLVLLADRFQPDIVHTQFMIYWLSLASSALCGQGRPLVLTLHGFTLPSEPSGSAGRLALRALYGTMGAKLVGNASAIICVSEEVRAKMAVVYPRSTARARVLPIGIDPIFLDTTKTASREYIRSQAHLEGKRAFVFLGRVVQDKGIAELAEAFRVLRQKRTDVSLLVVGDGSGVPVMKRILRDVPDVHFFGFRSDVGNYLSAADVMVLPSYREGFSTALLEAMYFRLPFVATPVGSAHDLVRCGARGALVKAKDTVDLLDGMIQLADIDPQELASWGDQNWRLTMQRFTWDSIVDGLLAVYQEVLY